MLFADWLMQFGREAGLPFNQYGSSGDSFTIGSPNDFNITGHCTETEPYLRFVSSDASQQSLIDLLASQAALRIKQASFGSTVWHSATCLAPDYQIATPFSMGSFMERLSNQTRVVGWRRLGWNVLIEFVEELPQNWDSKNALFAPKALVHVHIAVPAPCVGNFSSHIAHAVLETTAAICSFALGRAVSLAPNAFPTRPEIAPLVQARQFDQSVLTLARKHIGLDIFTLVGVPGGFQCFQQLRSAFLTFDAARHQEHDVVACILYVVVAECLTTLSTPWRESKLTKRFIEFFDGLMPEELNQLTTHGNFEAVFGIRRGARTSRALRREMLEKIYEFRSGNLHAGLQPSYSGFGSGFDTGENMRRAFFAEFAEGSILRYLSSPRSSVVGHPNCL
ncbi:MAG TPA: hypothetical protein VFR90_06250 [Methylibium sp.]|uniref:hypothetical protein n=1 Tax=Methylibium sp. TaxID=2067992 RepID=UPI002DC0310E|nr:hypothetical protein [Methylibium sp.]HEU4458707.1 hypothetical protein [Methylibium sp.]